MIFNCPICKIPLEINDSDPEANTRHAHDGTSSVHCPRCGDVEIPAELEVTRIASQPGQLAREKLAHFSLLRVLGSGGFGSVWLAEDENLGRQVALKIPISKDRDVRSLLHEAKTTARLKHPNIVSVFEVGIEENQVYIASEFIDGMTLRDLLTTGKPATERTVEILIAVSSALQHAHDQGVVHRDIKPANIMIHRDGTPYVTDFGLAKKISADASISSEGQVLGTAKYMSPEQASGKTRETDYRSDIYSIGVILFEMLTMHLPFRGNVRAILHQKIYEDAPSPKTLDPAIPKDLETICIKCLEREPEKRYQKAQELADELRRFQSGDPILSRPISSTEKVWRWCKRRPGVTALLLSLFLSLSIGLTGVSFFWIKAERSAAISNRMFYRSQMKLALQYLDQGDANALQQTLFPFKDGQSLAALRGFEWDYYDVRSEIFQQVVSIDDPVLDVAISGQGDLFTGCGGTKTLTVWETESGKVVQTITLPVGKFNTVAFSPTSNILATGSTDGMIRLWQPQSSDKPYLEATHGPQVVQIRFSPDGKYVASAGKTGAVRIFEVETLNKLAECPTAQFELKDFRFSPDSQKISIATSNEYITDWSVAGPERLNRIGPIPLMTSFTYADDGNSLAVGTFAGEVMRWSLKSRTLVGAIPAGQGAVGDLEYIQDPPRLLVAKQVGDLFVVDPFYMSETNRVTTHVLSFGLMDRSINGKRIVCGSGDGTIKVLRAEHLTAPDVIWKDKHIRQAETLDDAEQIVTLIGDERVELTSMNKLESFPIPVLEGKNLTSLAVQKSGSLLAVACVGNEVVIWDRKLKKITSQIFSDFDGPTEVLFSNSERFLTIAKRTGEVEVYDVEKLTTPLLKWKSTGDKLNTLLYSPHDLDLIVAFEDGRIEFRDMNQGGELKRTLNIAQVPLALCFCGRENRLIIGTNSGQLLIWNQNQPEGFKTIKAHSSRINDIVAFNDGIRFATGSRDKLIKVWDIEAGEQITSLFGHLTQVFSLSLTSDGSKLISGGLSGDIRIWRGR